MSSGKSLRSPSSTNSHNPPAPCRLRSAIIVGLSYLVLVLFLVTASATGQTANPSHAAAGNSNTAPAAQSQTPAATTSPQVQDDPDIPAFAQGSVDKQTYLEKRAEHMNLLRGLSADRPVDPHARSNAIRRMEQQEGQRPTPSKAPSGAVTRAVTTAASTSASTGTWTAIGPAPLPIGQTYITPAPVTGRITSIAVHPTN